MTRRQDDQRKKRTGCWYIGCWHVSILALECPQLYFLSSKKSFQMAKYSRQSNGRLHAPSKPRTVTSDSSIYTIVSAQLRKLLMNCLREAGLRACWPHQGFDLTAEWPMNGRWRKAVFTEESDVLSRQQMSGLVLYRGRLYKCQLCMESGRDIQWMKDTSAFHWWQTRLTHMLCNSSRFKCSNSATACRLSRHITCQASVWFSDDVSDNKTQFPKMSTSFTEPFRNSGQHSTSSINNLLNSFWHYRMQMVNTLIPNLEYLVCNPTLHLPIIISNMVHTYHVLEQQIRILLCQTQWTGFNSILHAAFIFLFSIIRENSQA